MIRLLVRLGQWLDRRFPERLEVSKEEYIRLLARIDAIENTAVHKEAVGVAVRELAKLKDDYMSFKAAMGFGGPAKTADILAHFNGEPVNTGEQNG